MAPLLTGYHGNTPLTKHNSTDAPCWRTPLVGSLRYRGDQCTVAAPEGRSHKLKCLYLSYHEQEDITGLF